MNIRYTNVTALEKTIKRWEQGLRYAQRRQMKRALLCIDVGPYRCDLCKLVAVDKGINCARCIIVAALKSKCTSQGEYIRVFEARPKLYKKSEVTSKELAKRIEKAIEKLYQVLEYAKKEKSERFKRI